MCAILVAYGSRKKNWGNYYYNLLRAFAVYYFTQGGGDTGDDVIKIGFIGPLNW